MSRLLRLAIAIVEATSLPLLVLTALYVLSGYQLLNPGLRLLPMARAVHVDRALRVVFVVLVYLHSLSGFILVLERRVRSGALKAALEGAVFVLLTTLIAVALAIEFMTG